MKTYIIRTFGGVLAVNILLPTHPDVNTHVHVNSGQASAQVHSGQASVHVNSGQASVEVKQ